MVPVLAAAQGPSCTSAPPVVFVQTGPTTYTTERDVAAKRNGDCIGVATYVRTSDGFLRFQVQWAPCVGTTWRLGIDHGTMSAALRAAGIAPTCPVVPPVVVPPVVPPISPATKWVMGYYVGYQRNLYPESQIDFSLLTHIAVGAIEPNGVGGVLTDFFVNAVDGPVMAIRFDSSNGNMCQQRKINL